MKRPRIRISTLMLLVVVVALVAALVLEHGRSEALRARMEVSLQRERVVAAKREMEAAWSLAQAQEMARESTLALIASSYGLEPAVFSAVVAGFAKDELRGVPESEVLEDFAAIAKDLPGPIEITDASAPYILYRRDKKQSRAEAVKSARAELRLKAAAETIKAAK